MARPVRRAGPSLPSIVVVAAVTVVAFVTAWLMEHGSYDTWAAIPVLIGLAALNVPLLRRAARIEVDPRMATLLWIAFAAKLAAALPRYAVAFDVYDGQADAAAYSRIGADLARQFRDGNFDVDLGREVQGTGFIQILTGAVYSITGATTIGGFLVFAAFGFWGLYLLYRAFVRACPDGDHRRYALLVLFLPSLLFWPSSIGKEAWMTLGLGVVAYGAARLVTGARGGIPLLLVGFAVLGIVRPHVAALIGFAVFLGYLLRRPPKGASLLAPLGKLVVILLMVAGLGFAVGQLEDFFGVDDFNQDAVETTLDEVTRRTGQGGSELTQDSGTDLNPSRFPEAFISVILRPFPWEANNLQALLASAESLFIMGLAVVSWRSILGSLRSMLRTPYVIVCVTYTILFVYGFSAFSNAGILVRQRVQVLPFVLVLLCLPAVRPREEGVRSLLGMEERHKAAAR